MIVFAIAGIPGVPWSSDVRAGWQVLLGPTGGYVVGFIAEAAFVGWLAERW